MRWSLRWELSRQSHLSTLLQSPPSLHGPVALSLSPAWGLPLHWGSRRPLSAWPVAFGWCCFARRNDLKMKGNSDSPWDTGLGRAALASQGPETRTLESPGLVPRERSSFQ